MIDEPAPLTPQWWWASIVIPMALAFRWLITLGREGQAELLHTQSKLVSQLLETNESLRRRNAELEREVDILRSGDRGFSYRGGR